MQRQTLTLCQSSSDFASKFITKPFLCRHETSLIPSPRALSHRRLSNIKNCTTHSGFTKSIDSSYESKREREKSNLSPPPSSPLPTLLSTSKRKVR